MLGLMFVLALGFVETFNIPMAPVGNLRVGLDTRFDHTQTFRMVAGDEHGFVTATVGAGTPNSVVEVCLLHRVEAEGSNPTVSSQQEIDFTRSTECGWSLTDRRGAASILLQSQTVDVDEVGVYVRDIETGAHTETPPGSRVASTHIINKMEARLDSLFDTQSLLLGLSFLCAYLFSLWFRRRAMPLTAHLAFQLYANALSSFGTTIVGIICLSAVSLSGTNDQSLLMASTDFGVIGFLAWMTWAMGQVYLVKVWRGAIALFMVLLVAVLCSGVVLYALVFAVEFISMFGPVVWQIIIR